MIAPRLALSLALLSLPPFAAAARPADATRIVRCDAGDCLLVRGHRASPEAAVRVNGHPVEVRGGTAWRAELPVETVRAWSTARARTLDVSVSEPDAAAARTMTLRLPVGMFARPTELASLVVRAR